MVTELNNETLKDFVGEGVVLVDIWATWCGPCKMIAPIVDQISEEYEGKVKVGKLEADKFKDVVTELGVRSIPTLVFYKDGEIVDKLVGMKQKEEIKAILDKNL